MTFPDTDSFNTYGGRILNYAPVEDPTTDRDALMANQAYASVAAMTHMTPFAWVRFTTVGSGTSVALTASNPRDQAWPVYPTNAEPTVTRNGVGDYTVTWPSTVIDEDGATHTLNFRGGDCSVEGTVPSVYTVSAPTVNTVRVRLFSPATLAATDNVGATLLVQAQ